MDNKIYIVANIHFLNKVRNVEGFIPDLGYNLKGKVDDKSKGNKFNDIQIRDVFVDYYVNNFRKQFYKNGSHRHIIFYQNTSLPQDTVQFFLNDWSKYAEISYTDEDDTLLGCEKFIVNVVKKMLNYEQDDEKINQTIRISCPEVEKYKCPDITNPDKDEYLQQLLEWRKNINAATTS